MPRAANGVAADQALGERAAVVRAGRADRQHVVAAAQHDDGLATGVPEQRCLADEIAYRDAGFQIGAGELGVVSTHAA